MNPLAARPAYFGVMPSGNRLTNNATINNGPVLNIACSTMAAPMPCLTRNHPNTRPVKNCGSTKAGINQNGVSPNRKLFRCMAANPNADT